MSDDSALREADQFIGLMREAIHSRFMNIDTARELLRTVLKKEMWRHRIVLMTERPKDYVQFAQFVTDPPPEGLSTTIATLETVAHGDVELVGLLDEVTKKGDGRPNKTVNNIDSLRERPRGDSIERAMRDLHEKRSDLEARVIAGELSPHAAMIEAGFRKRKMTIPTDIDGIARALKRRLTADEIAELLDLL